MYVQSYIQRCSVSYMETTDIMTTVVGGTARMTTLTQTRTRRDYPAGVTVEMADWPHDPRNPAPSFAVLIDGVVAASNIHDRETADKRAFSVTKTRRGRMLLSRSGNA